MMNRVSPGSEVDMTEMIEITEPVMLRGSTQPMTAVRPASEAGELAHAARQPSYHATPWPIVNRALDMADTLTGGRAGILQRVFNYLLFGGFAATVNLILITLLYYKLQLPISSKVHYIIAFLIATEVSIMTNFIPQDLVTFRHLPGHSRRWIQRGLRFHMTSSGGVIVTLVISFTLHEILGLQLTLAQAIAIIVALSFNFTFHHIFTYRTQHKPVVL